MKSKSQLIQEMIYAHTNLNTFGSVVSLMENGHLYGSSNHQRSARQIVDMAKRAIAIEFKRYERARLEFEDKTNEN